MAGGDLLVRASRWRVPLGFIVLPLVLWRASPTPLTLAIGGTIALAGEALRVWAAGHLNKSREVTSSGPYRWFAHPLYVGSSVMGLGLAIACADAIAASLVAIYLGVTLTVAVKAEEAFLRSKFGDDYARYRRAPSGAAGAGSDRRFATRQAMANREYRAATGVLVIVAILLLKLIFWTDAV